MTSRIVVSLRVTATPEHAFDVFTREIGAWWTPSTFFRFARRSPGCMSLEAGIGGRLIETFDHGEVFEIGRITAWEAGRRLAFTWRQATFTADELTRVEVRFEPCGTATRVTVEHYGWESVPQDHVARHGSPDTIFLRRHAEWWQQQLSALQERSLAASG